MNDEFKLVSPEQATVLMTEINSAPYEAVTTNETLWDMQRQISAEIVPIIRKRQLAWLNSNPDCA